MRTAHVEIMLQRGTVACRLNAGDRLWARHQSWSHAKEIDWAGLCPPVCALQMLYLREKTSDRSRLDLACATCGGLIPVWLVMSCDRRLAERFPPVGSEV